MTPPLFSTSSYCVNRNNPVNCCDAQSNMAHPKPAGGWNFGVRHNETQRNKVATEIELMLELLCESKCPP